jgi:hypothetical protein
LKLLLQSWKGSDQILEEIIHAGSLILRYEIQKLIHSIWNKEEMPDQWKESYCTSLQGG